VVELFLSSDPNNPNAYEEFEWAPNGEKLDVRIDESGKNFDWTSGAESVATVDGKAKIWRIEARIPAASLTDSPPNVGTRWRANLFRNDADSHAFLAWNPTLADTTHVPERFGWLEFSD
jgi:hypothetical protein